MKWQRTALGVLMLTALLLGLPVVLSVAQGPQPPRSQAPQTTLGTAFTYQGQLKSGGEPVNGECQMAFRLYDAEANGSELGAVTHTVVISDGLFTASLGFDEGVFAGETRWLGVRVNCPGDGGFSDLDRQPLTAAPYAQYSLSSGAPQGKPVTTPAPVLGEVLEWDGSWWAPAVVDSDPSDDLTAATTFGGDVQGSYDSLALATGAITPTHLNGLADSGASGQVLASDGGGGFAWQSGVAVRQLVQDLVVASGETVSAGDVVSFLDGQIYGPKDEWGVEEVFYEAPTSHIAVSSLSDVDFVVAYRNVSGHGTLITGTVGGGGVIWGTAEEFNAGSTYYIAVSSLSATDFVVAYKDASNSSYGTAITGTVSGGSLSFGTAEVFNAGVSNYIVVEALSPSAFLIAYQDTGNFDYGTAITGTTIGGGLSFGSEEAFNMTTTSHIAVEALSSTDFVIAYRDEGNSDYGTAMTGTLGGGGLSWGSGSVFNAAGTYYVDIASLSATDFVVAYGDAGNSNYGTAILGTVGGSGLSWGSESVFNAASTTQIRISGLAIPDFAVVYNDGGNFSYGTGIVGTVSGGGVDWGAESVFNAAATYWGDVSSLSPTDFVLAYRDDGNSNHGTAIVGHWGRFIGTAKTSASGGETASVIVSGVSDVHSGLVPGAVYFLQGDGSLGLTLTGRRVGLDISASELLLDQLW